MKFNIFDLQQALEEIYTYTGICYVKFLDQNNSIILTQVPSSIQKDMLEHIIMSNLSLFKSEKEGHVRPIVSFWQQEPDSFYQVTIKF